MKKSFMIIALLPVLSLAAAAQDKNEETFESFRQQRSEQEETFARQRQREFEEFRTRYYAAFGEFIELYRSFLQDEESVLELMASDDGIKILPADKAPVPRVVSTVKDQRRIMKASIKAVGSMKPDDFLPVFSENRDTVARMQEAAEAMEEIVSAMKQDGGSAGHPDTPVGEEDAVEVVLEPFDPEYFSSLPDVDDAGSVRQDTESGEEQADCAVSGTETPGGMAETDLSVPEGKPTEYVRISSPFGTRIHPITRRKHTHKGVDLAAPRMTPVYATADGIVTYSGRNGGYGNFVKINHRNGYKTAYAHMHRIEVRKNSEVHKGDLIGYVGSTGSSTGNHLHYELYYGDGLLDPATTL